MVNYIWSAIFRSDLTKPAYRLQSLTIIRLFMATLGGGALVLTYTDGSLASEHTSQIALTKPRAYSEGSIQLAAYDLGSSPSAEDAPITAKVRHVRRHERERVIFEFDAPVQHVMHLDRDQLIIWFDHDGRFELERIRTNADDHLRHLEAVGGDVTRWVTLLLAPDSRYWSVVEQEGRRLIINMASPSDTAGPKQDGMPTAEIESLVALPSAPQSDGWTPRRRTTPRPEPTAVKHDATVKESSGGQPGVTRKPMAPTSHVAVHQAVPKGEGVGSQKKPAVLAKAEPAPSPSLQTAAPGQFDVDEQALDRALERTLTREGAVLLPFGTVEIEPSISYVRREFDAPTLINLFGFPAFGETVVRRNELIATLAARIGLPLDSQLELDVPYRYVDQSATTMIGFNALDETDDDTAAFGDLGVGLAKTLLREDSWWPDAVARVRWDSGTGKTADNGIALGGGTHEITGSLSLVKSQDPLAFFGSLAYEKTFEENEIDRGDRIGVSVGTVLAASPDTSLRASIRQDFIGDAEVDGDDVAGSDRMAATLSIGASSVLGRGVLLDASVDVGLTDDAPDYAARVSLPIRFNPSRYLAFGDRDTLDDQALNEDEKTSPGR